MIVNFKLKIKNLSRGFTLIELMVAITVSMVIITGLGLSINNYYNLEKINQTKSELAGLLSLARTLAVTNQRPEGLTDDLGYVAITISAQGLVTATAYSSNLGVGGTYFSRDVTDSRVEVNSGSNLNFLAGSGKLVDSFGVLLNPATEVVTTISSLDVAETRSVIITSLGTLK